jgi:hypothetical protein
MLILHSIVSISEHMHQIGDNILHNDLTVDRILPSIHQQHLHLNLSHVAFVPLYQRSLDGYKTPFLHQLKMTLDNGIDLQDIAVRPQNGSDIQSERTVWHPLTLTDQHVLA